MNSECSDIGSHEDDGNAAVFLLQALDVRHQLERLLVVRVTHARVHQLRHLEDLQQLRVALQRDVVHAPSVANESITHT